MAMYMTLMYMGRRYKSFSSIYSTTSNVKILVYFPTIAKETILVNWYVGIQSHHCLLPCSTLEILNQLSFDAQRTLDNCGMIASLLRID